MTPDVQAALDRLSAFAKACPDNVDVIVNLRPLEPAGDPIPLHMGDLRALLDAADPAEEESIEWATLQRWPSDGREQIVGPAPESHARYRRAKFPMHVALMHRQVRYGPWIEGEPTAAEDTKGPEQ